MTAWPPQVHLPAEYRTDGRGRVRAVCSCGHATTPRITQDRALTVLLEEHGYTDPICAVCGTDHYDGAGRVRSRWDALLRHIEIVDDPVTGGTALVCRGESRPCRPAAPPRSHIRVRNELSPTGAA